MTSVQVRPWSVETKIVSDSRFHPGAIRVNPDRHAEVVASQSVKHRDPGREQSESEGRATINMRPSVGNMASSHKM